MDYFTSIKNILNIFLSRLLPVIMRQKDVMLLKAEW